MGELFAKPAHHRANDGRVDQDGVRKFDLSIGNYAFKRRFGAAQFPLTDASIALGWRGIPYALRDRAAQGLRRHPWLAERVGRALGKLSHDDE
jgi:CelD/BcsL family acetyltransferase involved in cellulose biosynthesis